VSGAGQRVLVLGASGFVGGAVSRRLLAAGRQVTALVRDPGSAAAGRLADAGARVHGCDMLAPATYVPLVAEADAVVHAAQLRFPGRLSAARVARMRAAELTTARALAEACLRHGRRLLLTGGAFVYGDHGDGWISESTPHRPSPLGVGHARSAALLRELGQRGLDAVELYAGFVYGPGGNFKDAFLDQVPGGRLRHPGDGRNHWSCVHLDDLADGYLAALDHAPAGRAYNLVDDEPLPLADLTRQVARATGVPRVSGVPGPLVALALGRAVARSLTTSYRVSNRRARDEIGWNPAHPTVAEGLPSVLAALAAGTPDGVTAPSTTHPGGRDT